MAEVFTDRFARQYDEYSSKFPNPFDGAAQALVRFDGGIRAGETVVEIGLGTGNATVIIAGSCPKFGRYTGVEPSTANIGLARYKLHGGYVLPEIMQGSSALYYIEQKKNEAYAAGITDRIEIMQGSFQGRDLEPELRREDAVFLPEGFADRVYAPSSFHWLAFKDGSSSFNPHLLGSAVGEINRILKPGGRFLFDSNGHLLKLGNQELEGRRIDDLHFTQSPLWSAFNHAFVRVLVSSGFDTAHLNQRNTDRFEGIFTVPGLSEMLESRGFKKLATEEGMPFELTLIDYTPEMLINSASSGAKMNKFGTEQLAALPEEQKEELVNKAIDTALQENPSVFTKPHYETFMTFGYEKAA